MSELGMSEVEKTKDDDMHEIKRQDEQATNAEGFGGTEAGSAEAGSAGSLQKQSILKETFREHVLRKPEAMIYCRIRVQLKVRMVPLCNEVV
ncbi:hypothetical protein BCON_0052g00290 [Botryotinia convoluta]|uniref:Uncharacterized protein n=1 Tax=Botryotinia convoluta TaxID=54673 RepID=A0A4Z1IBL0_9HELO|nr:hypothetical protein BCON_0052g00290 [Botryotinia convoluta]